MLSVRAYSCAYMTAPSEPKSSEDLFSRLLTIDPIVLYHFASSRSDRPHSDDTSLN